MDSVDFDKRLEELLENFRRQLPERLSTILESWKLYQESRDSAVLEDLRFHTHKLAGAASTYGYAEVGETSRKIEHRLDTALADGEFSGIEADLEPHLHQLETLIAAC